MFFVVYLLLTSLQTFAAPAEVSDVCRRLSPMPESSFSGGAFATNLEGRKDIDSVEKALCLIPASVRGNYVLMKASPSAQHSRPLQPRAIMFDPSDKTGWAPLQYAISFNGHPEDTQFNAIEIIQVNPVNGRERLTFFDIEFEEGSGAKVHRNPELCMQCHRDGVGPGPNYYSDGLPRLIWHAKGFTPSAYGQTSFSGSAVEDDKEVGEFERFVALAAQDRRYGQLLNLTQYLEESRSTGRSRLHGLVRQNGLFAARMGFVNRSRLADLILDTSDYQKYKFAILAALLECSSIEKFVPKDQHNKHANRSFLHPMTRDYLNNRVSYDQLKRAILSELGSSITATENDVVLIKAEVSPAKDFLIDMELKGVQWGQTAGWPIANLRWLLEGRGISMENWSLDVGIRPGSYRFLNGPGSDPNPNEGDMLAIEIMNRDSELALLSYFGKNVTINNFNDLWVIIKKLRKPNICRSLQKLSLARF